VVTALGWVHDGQPTYTLEGIIISSAATLTWLCDQLGLAKDAKELEALARSVDDTNGVYLVPAFSGLGLPHWRPDARAALVGLTAHSDRRHVARAALESMAYQLRDALEAMQQDGNVRLTSLHADGGPTANTLLMQFAADLTGVELRVATSPDCSPLGATLAGLLGAGVHATLDTLAALPREELIYRPTMPPARVAALHTAWRHAVKQTLA
jgi:glycerol kinase